MSLATPDATPSTNRRALAWPLLELMTPGPVGLRTRWIETREVMGRLDTAEMEITAYERNPMYTITHHKAGVRIDTTFWFEPQEDGTKVSIEFELDSAGLPPGLLGPLGLGHRRAD